MDDIGVSLFQDAGNLQFNSNDDEHQDKEEEEEERIRRNEEIQNNLEELFDDLVECNSVDSSHYKDSTQCIEDVSINSSSKFHTAEKNRTPVCNDYETNMRPNIKTDIAHNTSIPSHNNYRKLNHELNYPFDQQRRDQFFNTPSSRYSDQLNMYTNNGHIEEYNNCQTHGNRQDDLHHSSNYIPIQLTLKQREIDSLENALKQRDDEVNLLKQKLQIQQDQIESSNKSSTDLQQSYDKAKAEINFLELQVKTLKEGNEVQNNIIEKFSEDLSISESLRIDLQNKIDMLKSVQSNNEKLNAKLKQDQERCATDLKNMQNQIDQLSSTLEEKKASYDELEQNFNDMRQKYEATISENKEKINNLTRLLDNSQSQNLMASKNSRDVAQLQNQLDIALKENKELLHKIEDLEHKLILAHNDEMQSLAWLRHCNDEQSDSIQQLKLGSAKVKSNSDDIVSKLRGELQRCLEGQSLKRKEINRLEAALSQKQNELEEALMSVNSYSQKIAEDAERIDQLESELKSVLSEQALKADTEIKKLSDYLNEMKKQNETLKKEKQEIEEKLEDTLSLNQELSKLHQTSINDAEISSTMINKEYLEIHKKAVQWIKKEAEDKQLELELQLKQMQNYLDHVKKSYIDICASKEQLINEHQQEIKSLKEKYENYEATEELLEKREQELNKQTKLVEKLLTDCEKYQNRIIELEKDIELEKRRKSEHAKMAYKEIEKAKEEAIKELRNAHPNHNISFHMPDYCSEHMDKIAKLENDCKRLEEKQQKLSDVLHDVRLKLAQTEINKEAYVKKYDNLQKEIIKMQSKYEEVLAEKNACREKLVKLEQELADAGKICDSCLKAQATDDRTNLNEDCIQMKNKLKNLKNIDDLLEHIKELEKDLHIKEEKLKEMGKIKNERDDLETKLKNQAKTFKQFLKNQKQVSAELNTSSCGKILEDSSEAQKMKEVQKIKEVREEWKQKVEEKLKEIEDKHQITLNELKKDYQEKSKELETLKETSQVEKLQLQASFKKQEQKIVQIIEARISEQLLLRKVQIKELQEKLAQKEDDVEKERNVMAQLLSNWSMELKVIQNREKELREEFKKVKSSEESLIEEIKLLKEKKLETESSLKAFKKKYNCTKKIARNYKEHAEKKDKRFQNECKRIEENYKKTMAQVQQKIDTIISVQDKEMAEKLREVEAEYTEKLKKYEQSTNRKLRVYE